MRAKASGATGTVRSVRHSIGLPIGVIIVSAVVLAAIFAPLISPNDPYAVDLSIRMQGPSSQYPLGTDQLGRCVLSRLIYGARVSLGAAACSLVITVVLGSLIGLLAGYVGGALDKCIMWVTDVMMAFPGTMLALVIVGIFGTSMFNLVISIAAVSWASFARNVRSLMVSEKNADYVKVAIVAGTSRSAILFRHILPNILMPTITLAVTRVSGMIMRIAGLSFLGLGAQLPTAEWGLMINDARQVMMSDPRLIITAIGAVFITVLGVNLLGDGLRDRFDPSIGGDTR